MSPQVETSSLGGLTVLRASSAVGRNLAALVFRVGRFDETLATAGITHLVEHLALAGQGEAPYDFNAEVSGRFTTFSMESADPRDVGDFVSTVCDGLTVDHRAGLEQEKRILRTEAASRGNAAMWQALVDAGGDENRRDRKGYTPRQVGKVRDVVRVVRKAARSV